jgi:hypothetical protein
MSKSWEMKYIAKGYSWVETKAESLWTIVCIMPYFWAYTKKYSPLSSYKGFLWWKMCLFLQKKPPHWSTFVWDAPIQRDEGLILLVEVVIMGIHFSYGMMELPWAVDQKQGTWGKIFGRKKQTKKRQRLLSWEKKVKSNFIISDNNGCHSQVEVWRSFCRIEGLGEISTNVYLSSYIMLLAVKLSFANQQSSPHNINITKNIKLPQLLFQPVILRSTNFRLLRERTCWTVDGWWF